MTSPSRAHVTVSAPLRQLKISLDRFAWEALSEESQRLGVPVEELANFSVMYYLADVDSGRIAREIPSRNALAGSPK